MGVVIVIVANQDIVNKQDEIPGQRKEVNVFKINPDVYNLHFRKMIPGKEELLMSIDFKEQ